jgi:hypothetical protein
MIVLPRQARDKHRENTTKKGWWFRRRGDDSVRENGSFEPFLYKCDHFTKTGSGQT